MRTKNIQASRSRTDNFISSVSQTAHLPIQQSSSPLYGTPNRGTPSPGADLLSLNPVGDQQLLVMEEAQPQNSYIQERGQAIEAIESTINELGSIFGQLAAMVSEQGNMVRSPFFWFIRSLSPKCVGRFQPTRGVAGSSTPMA